MTDTTVETPRAAREGLVRRIFLRGREFDFIGQSRTFLFVSVALLTLVVLGGLLRGLNFNIEFTGGTGYTVTEATRDFSTEELRDALGEVGVEGAIVQVVDDGNGALVSTPVVGEIGSDEQRAVLDAIVEVTGADPQGVEVNAVGPRWGQQITRQSLEALAVFLVLVALYLALRFEWRMAAAAILTLAHDIVLTVGIYALVGFEISPASVIAFLTILGYSLYDTVVVFDRVKEDTAGLSSVSTRTFGEAANTALNEVLVRSLSTSITSLLPVGSLLFIGAQLLGADTLEDLALALFVGMAVGTYSSIVIATPFLVWLKEKEPRWADLKQRVEARRGTPAPQPDTAPAAERAETPATAPPTGPKRRSKKSRAKRRR